MKRGDRGKEEKEKEEEKPPEPEIKIEEPPDFLIGVDNSNYNSKLYKCKWNDEYAVGYFDSNAAVSSITFNKEKEFMFIGDKGGRLRIRNKRKWRYYTELYLHDGNNGLIRNIKFSFDNKFILTSSDDGSIAVFRFLPESFKADLGACMMYHDDYIKRFTFNPVLPNFEDLLDNMKNEFGRIQEQREIVNDRDISTFEEPEEIESDSYYSIEQAKLKQEEERKMTEAEKHKKYVREQVNKLREKFEELRKQDMEDAPEMRLTQNDYLALENDYWDLLKQEGDDMKSEVNKIMEWISLKRKMEFEKVRDYYLKNLYAEGFSVKSFNTPLSVRSLRTISHNEKLLNIFASIHFSQENNGRQSRESINLKGKKYILYILLLELNKIIVIINKINQNGNLVIQIK